MKSIILMSLLLTNVCVAQNVVTAPATTAANTVTPTATGVVGLTVNSSSGQQAAIVGKNTNDWDGIQGFSSSGAGVYAHGDSFAGIYADSTTGTSAWFSSNSSSNPSPTLIVQSVGGSADLVEIQSNASAVLMSIDSNGALKADSGIKIPNSGSCDSSHRRFMKVVEGAAGVTDLFQVCLKNASDVYAWVTK